MSTTESAQNPPANASSNKKALLIVFIVVFIDLLGFGIVLPIMPRISNKYAHELIPAGASRELWSGVMVGLLFSSFSLMQFIFSPFWGQLSDRVGRRPILLMGLAGSVFFYTLFGIGAALPNPDFALWAVVLFFASRIGAGIFGATIGTAQAVIADSTPPDKRKHGMALIGAAFGIGFTFGPLVGYAALHWYPDHLGIVGYAAAGLSALALILGWRLLPETRKLGEESPRVHRGFQIDRFKAALANPAIGPVILTFFLTSVGFSAFEVTLALFLENTMGYKEDISFLLFAYVGFVLMMTQGVLYRRLAKRLSEVTFMLIGVLLMAIGVGALGGVNYLHYHQGWAPDDCRPLLFLGLTAAVIGFAFVNPSATALISRRTEATQQGEVLGINQSAASMARIVGPLVGLPLYKATSSHMLPYIFGAVLLLILLPLVARVGRTATEPSTAA